MLNVLFSFPNRNQNYFYNKNKISKFMGIHDSNQCKESGECWVVVWAC